MKSKSQILGKNFRTIPNADYHKSFLYHEINKQLMDQATQSLIEFILVVVFLPIIAYLLLIIFKKSKIKGVRSEKNLGEDAYNQIQMLDSMIKMMNRKGYNTSSVESMLLKAREAYDDENYASCMEIINNAKRILMKIDKITEVEDKVSPTVAEEMKIIKRIEEEATGNEELPPQVKEFERKMPSNFLQSKFEIKVVEEKILKKEEGEVKQAAMLYLNKAKEYFENREYTEALRFAVKSNRILDTNEIPEGEFAVPQTAPSPPPPSQPQEETQEEIEVEEELHCPNCGAVVKPGDKYCWNCGAKLVFIYKCPNCGAEVSSEDNYCRHCGYKLK